METYSVKGPEKVRETRLRRLSLLSYVKTLLNIAYIQQTQEKQRLVRITIIPERICVDP